MNMARRIRDPDFGSIELPEPPTREEFEKNAGLLRERGPRGRLWPSGSVGPCPNCGRRGFVGRDNLEMSLPKPGGAVIFRGLRGARCDGCGAQVLEADDLIRVEAEAVTAIASDYEAKVSRIGSGTLGTYWPRDVVRSMGLTPATKAFIQVLDRRTALVRFDRPKDGPDSAANETARSEEAASATRRKRLRRPGRGKASPS